MKRLHALLTTLVAIFFVLQPLSAQVKVNDVDINVSLDTDGSARIREIWDMSVNSGTEVYLARQNLGDIKILDLSVSDDKGLDYNVDRNWSPDRSFEKKAGRCGLNSVSGGYEICWGIGEYGHRIYTVEYTLTNLVKSLDDYDMIHYQFYTPNDFNCGHVRVVIEKPGFVMDSLTRIWAFGYHGTILHKNAGVCAESDAELGYYDSVIILMRFDKGIFQSKSVQDRSFQTVLDRALEGADEPDVPMSKFEEIIYTFLGILLILFFCMIPFMPLIERIIQRIKQRKNFFGTTWLRDISWSREVPYGGDILKNFYVILNSKDIKVKNSSVASAMILSLLQRGFLSARKDLASGKLEIRFNDEADASGLESVESKLISMMKEASGENKILEDKEFSAWAKKKSSVLRSWSSDVMTAADSRLRAGDYCKGSKFTPKGRAENVRILGLKKFLEDTTLIGQRSTPEVSLWRDYLVFASLVGIADKVAKELKDINPVVFEQACSMSYGDMSKVIYLANSYGNVFGSYRTTSPSYSGSSTSSGGFSRSGGGGRSSYGGGGGYSGGGRSGVR